MGDLVFITGVPGFIGKRVASWALRRPGEAVLLVQARFREAAEKFVAAERTLGAPARATILEGDITKPGLGLTREVLADVRARVTLGVHLAAAYDLALPREVGIKINVEGTHNVLDALGGAPQLKRIGYFSTTAISGDRTGPFRESDYDLGQKPKNGYEETKFLAEGVVRERWHRVPVVIFRPTIVVGDSRTGEAEKIDGPYYAFQMIERGLQLVAASSRAKFHLVPVDFVVRAMTTILEREDAAGKVFHLADPAPVTFDEFIDIACTAFGKRTPVLRLPPGLLGPVFKLPGAAKLTGVPEQSFAYTKYPVEYPCENTLAALAGTGVECPRFAEYATKLIRYYQEHLKKEATAGPRW
ncbi:MAG: SDR family oxidoreductase [Planctomycetes bacterium]|nr:SDR family oxidoreductase [Planctomycetota bacterium]